MKKIICILAIVCFFASCHTTGQMSAGTATDYGNSDTSITQSLFNDKGSTISEEGIQKILEGHYKLPSSLRVGIIRLDNVQKRRYYETDEEYAKTQQSYLDLFAVKFRQSPGVRTVSVIPDILTSRSPSFTTIREAAVRMQSDLVLVYSINSDLYSRYKIFSNPDMKAYATIQLVLLDVRTGLIPFSTVVTKDYLSKKNKGEMDISEAMSRVQKEAVLAAIEEAGQKIVGFLGQQ